MRDRIRLTEVGGEWTETRKFLTPPGILLTTARKFPTALGNFLTPFGNRLTAAVPGLTPAGADLTARGDRGTAAGGLLATFGIFLTRTGRERTGGGKDRRWLGSLPLPSGGKKDSRISVSV